MKTIFRKTEKSDTESLKKLWLSCFDENQTAVDLIFGSDLFNGCCAVVDDRIVSALYLVKGTLNGEKSHYLCGASTDKSFRGNGIMSRLIDFALDDAKNNGDVYSLLFPANDGLYGFYTKLGYAPSCTVKSREISRQTLENFAEKGLNIGCSKENSFIYNENFFEFAKSYYEIYGSKVINKNDCFAVFDENENTADVFYSAYKNINELSAFLLENTKSERFVFTGKSDNALFENCRFYVFLAEGFEETEALAPVDVMRRAKLDVKTVGVTGECVTSSHGVPVKADITIDNIDLDDVQGVVLPGGMPGTLNLEANEKVLEAVKYSCENGKIVAAICAAPSILGHLGILDGKKATCFPGFEKELKGADYTGTHTVTDGNIITAKGAGCAIEFGHAIVSLAVSKDAADKVIGDMQCL